MKIYVQVGDTLKTAESLVLLDFQRFERSFNRTLVRNHVNRNGGGGPSCATLRSISLTSEELEQIVFQMQSENTWIAYDHEKIIDLSECTPTQQELEHASFARDQNHFDSSSLWSESFVTGNSLRLTTLQPEHMRYVPVALASPRQGVWAVDLDIERTVDHSPFFGITHRWRLPRRLRVAQSFCKPYRIAQQNGRYIEPRVCAGGLLTLYTVANTHLPEIMIPTDYSAIINALENGRDWSAAERAPRPPQICYRSTQSNAGKYFWGTFQLLGDINTARTFLLHKFWRKQLESYEATDQRTDERQERMKNKLLQRIGERTLTLNDANQLHTLSDIVLQEADALRVNTRALEWTKFEREFRELIEDFNIANPVPNGVEIDLNEETHRHVESLRKAVQNFCKLGVFHQGYEHKCNKCLHRSWIGIADLKPHIICEVCREVQCAPIDKAWQFRINGFLREALRRYGIGPLFWVISHYQRNNNNSFWFEGPLNIYFDQVAAESNKPDTDIDLTIIENGIVRMCEVKQSARQFKDPVRLAQTMLRLRPDIATIAIMEANNEEITRKYELFAREFIGTGVSPNLLTLEEYSIEHNPWF